MLTLGEKGYSIHNFKYVPISTLLYPIYMTSMNDRVYSNLKDNNSISNYKKLISKNILPTTII